MASSPSSMSLKLACAMLLVMVVGAPVAQAAITRGTVTTNFSQCIPYLQKGVPLTAACCGGIKSLKTAAKTNPDRQQVCNCLKSAAAQIKGVNYGLVAGLPGKCGVSIPYKIIPQTDCSKFQ